MFGPVICNVVLNLFLSGLGNVIKKSFHALPAAAFAIFRAAAIFITNDEIFFQLNVRVRYKRYSLSHARREHERANFFLQGTDSKPSLYKTGLLFTLQFKHTLKKRGALSYKVGNKTGKEFIRPGHYNEDGIVKMLQNAFSNHPLSISTHTPTHLDNWKK